MDWLIYSVNRLTGGMVNLGKGEVFRSSLISICVKVLGALVSLGLYMTLSRTLGPEKLGYYVLTLTVVAILAVPLNYGLASLVLRETSSSLLNADWAKLRGLIRQAVQLTVGYTVFVAVLGWLGILLFGDSVAEGTRAALIPALILPIFWSGSEVLSASLRGMGRIIAGQVGDLILRPLFLAIFVLVAVQLYGVSSVSASDVMILHVGAAVISIIVVIGLLIKFFPAPISGVKVYHTKSWFNSLLHLSLLSGVMAVNGFTDILMLGYLATPEAVGIYRIAVQLALLISFTLSAMNVVLSNRVVKLYEAGSLVKLQNLLTQSSRAVLLSALPTALVFIYFGRDIIGLVFGEAFSQGADALIILTVGQLVNAALGSVSLVLNMIGLERETVKVTIVAAILNVVLNATLIPIWGIYGAALGTAVSLTFWNIYLVVQLYRRTNLIVSPVTFGLKRYDN